MTEMPAGWLWEPGYSQRGEGAKWCKGGMSVVFFPGEQCWYGFAQGFNYIGPFRDKATCALATELAYA